MQEHAFAGYELLKEIDFPWCIADIVHQHHEYIDGSGYPNQLKGDDILLEARIICVADLFEAVTSNRPHRPPYGADYAISILEEGKGKIYDSDVVDACLEVIQKDGFEF